MLRISNNSMSNASCWKKFYWKYVRGLTPRKRKHSMTIGTVVHDCFEKYYNGYTNSDVINFVSESYNEEKSTMEMADHEDLEISKHIALGMWAYYPYKNIDEFEEYIPEMEFSIPLASRRSVRFVGRIDGLVKINGQWWIREVKTTGLSLGQFRGRCSVSGQVTGYVYALRRMGYDVKGVLFDCIKRPLLRRRVTETAGDFGKRIMSQTYLTDSKMPAVERKYYTRHDEYRSALDIKLWLEDAGGVVDGIRKHMKDGRWRRDRDVCWKYNSLCGYNPICFQERPDQLTLELNYDYKEVEHVGQKRIECNGTEGREETE